MLFVKARDSMKTILGIYANGAVYQEAKFVLHLAPTQLLTFETLSAFTFMQRAVSFLRTITAYESVCG